MIPEIDRHWSQELIRSDTGVTHLHFCRKSQQMQIAMQIAHMQDSRDLTARNALKE